MWPGLWVIIHLACGVLWRGTSAGAFDGPDQAELISHVNAAPSVLECPIDIRTDTSFSQPLAGSATLRPGSLLVVWHALSVCARLTYHVMRTPLSLTFTRRSKVAEERPSCSPTAPATPAFPCHSCHCHSVCVSWGEAEGRWQGCGPARMATKRRVPQTALVASPCPCPRRS